MRHRIEQQRASLGGDTGRSSPQQGSDARNELGERERLRDVVVAACAEPRNTVRERVMRSQKQHRRLDSSRAERPADVAPICVREADVEHEEIRGSLGERVEQLATRSDSSRPEPLFLEPAQQNCAELEVVLDDEHARHQGHSGRVASALPENRTAADRSQAAVSPVASDGRAFRRRCATRQIPPAMRATPSRSSPGSGGGPCAAGGRRAASATRGSEAFR